MVGERPRGLAVRAGLPTASYWQRNTGDDVRQHARLLRGARPRTNRRLYRLFCILERAAPGLIARRSWSSGVSKPDGSSFTDTVIVSPAPDFSRHRSVVRPRTAC